MGDKSSIGEQERVVVPTESVVGNNESSKRPANEENEDTPAQPYKSFKIVSEEEQFSWSLPEGMATYANELFETYISDKGGSFAPEPLSW